jgi:hypothetical protein
MMHGQKNIKGRYLLTERQRHIPEDISNQKNRCENIKAFCCMGSLIGDDTWGIPYL